MGRTKGTRNHAGHKAGGARKGAGRKRISMTGSDFAADIAEGDQEQNQAVAGPSSLPGDYANEDFVCPVLKPHANLRHQVPLAMTPRFGNLQSSPLADPLPRLRLCPATWTSAHTESEPAVPVVATSFLRSTAYSLSSPVQLPTELSHQPLSPSVSSRHSSPDHSLEFSQTLSSEGLHDRGERPTVENSHEISVSSPALSYAEVDHQFEISESRHDSITRAQTPDSSEPSSPEPSPPLLPSRVATSRAPLVNIAPAPPWQHQQGIQQHRQDMQQQQQDMQPHQGTQPHQGAWMFPYPLPAMMASVFPHFVLASQVSINKRRRRRCAVCMQLGKEETSYDCPGRGDRARCASMQKKIRERSAKTKEGPAKTGEGPAQPSEGPARPSEGPAKATEEPNRSNRHEDREPENVSGSLSRPDRDPAPVTQNEPSSSQTAPRPGFVPPLPPAHIPPGYVALVPYGPPVRLVLAGENSKRRARRCMVCVTLGREGTQCPGRGSRALCPDYELAENLPAIRRWEPIVDEDDE